MSVDRGADAKPTRVARVALLAAAATSAVVLAGVAALSVLGGGSGATVGPSMSLDMPAAYEAAAPAEHHGSDEHASASPEVGVDGGLTVRPYEPAAFAGMPTSATEPPLSPAPDPALIETTASGTLPRIGPDGRRPLDAYARPFPRRDDRSRVVVIVTDIGLSRAAGDAAVGRLPGAVVIAVDAYATYPGDWARAAREAGHEVLAAVPLAPAEGSTRDAGPRALVPGTEAEQRAQLAAVLGRFAGYVGILLEGDGGTTGEEASRLSPGLSMLRDRGLMLVDGDAGPSAPLFQTAAQLGIPRARVTVVMGDGDADATDRQLASLEQAAREHFVAVGTIRATPTALERLRTWIARLDTTRYVLAPISAVAVGRE